MLNQLVFLEYTALVHGWTGAVEFSFRISASVFVKNPVFFFFLCFSNVGIRVPLPQKEPGSIPSFSVALNEFT